MATSKLDDTVTNMSRKYLASVAVVAAVAVGIGGYAAKSTTGDVKVSGTAMSILACMKPSLEGNQDRQIARDCLSDLEPTVMKPDDIADFNRAMKEATKREPRTPVFCHLVAHDMVQRLDPSLSQAALATGEWDSCTYGLLHGIIERIGSTHPSAEQWKDIIARCNSIDEYEASLQCGHSTGHALVVDRGDIMKSLPTCTELRNADDRRECGVGIFMRVYLAVGAPEYRDMAGDAAMLKTFCSPLEGEIRRVCIQGLSVVQATPIRKKITNDPRSLEPGEPTAEYLAFINQVSTEAMVVCDQFSGQDNAWCLAIHWDAMTNIDNPIMRNRTVLAQMCSFYPARDEENCLANGETNITNWEKLGQDGSI